MSTQNPSHGTKVTDPNAPSIEEGAGAVANDSLAAESSRADGTFADNRNSEPLGVSGSNSTFANKDTSGAKQLDPASNAEARLGDDSGSYPDAAGGQSKGTAVESTEDSSKASESSSSAGTAPSYVSSQHTDSAGPKGNNLKEGGFESDDSKNASWNSDIGDKNDPGRLATEQIQRQNAQSGADAGLPRQQQTTNDNAYDALGGDTQA